jgi:hypothetical protein
MITLMAVYNKYYTDYTSGADKSLPMYDDLFELLILHENKTNIFSSVHDGWALNMFFQGQAKGRLKMLDPGHEIWTKQKRIDQFQHYKRLSDIDRYKDVVSAAAIKFAIRHASNVSLASVDDVIGVLTKTS